MRIQVFGDRDWGMCPECEWDMLYKLNDNCIEVRLFAMPLTRKGS